MVTARDEIAAWLAGRTAAVVADGDDLVAIADRLAAVGGLEAAAFAAEAIDIARILGESVRSAAAFRAVLVTGEFDTSAARDMTTILSAAAAALAIGRVAWPSRPAARRARADLVTRAQAAYAVAQRFDPALLAWLSGLVGIAVRLVSQIAADATPIVRVESGISLPSTVLAYQLYGDAKRAAQVIEISGSGTPMLMPVAFDALAS